MKQLLVFLLFLCSASVSAQDVIVKKDGSTILSKVLEVGQNEIKYKRFDNQEGPTYTISKSELQAINYQNGAKDTFSTPVRDENRYLPNNQNNGAQQYNDRALLAMDAEMTGSLKKAKTFKTTAWIGGGILLAAGIVFLSNCDGIGDDWLIDDDIAPVLTLSCVGGAAIWTTTFLLLAHQQKSAVERFQSSSIIQQNINFSNGSSLSFGADMLRDRTLGSNTIGLGLRYNF